MIYKNFKELIFFSRQAKKNFNKLNFHGNILSAKYCCDMENNEEFERKLIFRKNEYNKYIEERKIQFFVPQKDEIQKKDFSQTSKKIKKIMKKTYWGDKAENSLTYPNHFVFLTPSKTKKIRINLKG